MPMIEMEDIKRHYEMASGVVKALDGVDISIEKGERVLLLGPSGSGKTTLLNCLSGLDSPTSGQYTFNGIEVPRNHSERMTSFRRENIGYVFQFFNLLPKLTVRQNVELPMIYSGFSSKERRERAMNALESVNMEDRSKHRPSQLSGGQQQRTAIARALVNNPKIIFADEPTGNLDSNTGERILQMFDKLHTEGKTVMLVTHDPEIAAVTPRRIEIRDGKIANEIDPKLSGQTPRFNIGTKN